MPVFATSFSLCLVWRKHRCISPD